MFGVFVVWRMVILVSFCDLKILRGCFIVAKFSQKKELLFNEILKSTMFHGNSYASYLWV